MNSIPGPEIEWQSAWRKFFHLLLNLPLSFKDNKDAQDNWLVLLSYLIEKDMTKPEGH